MPRRKEGAARLTELLEAIRVMQDIHDRHQREGTLESWPLAAQSLIERDKAEARELWRQGYRPTPKLKATVELKHDDFYITCSYCGGTNAFKPLPERSATPCTFCQGGIILRPNGKILVAFLKELKARKLV